MKKRTTVSRNVKGQTIIKVVITSDDGSVSSSYSHAATTDIPNIVQFVEGRATRLYTDVGGT